MPLHEPIATGEAARASGAMILRDRDDEFG
jgi:hypothetical protein